MNLKNVFKISSLLFCIFVLSSCLKTRSDVAEDEQSQVYSKKNASNQLTSDSQLNQKQVTAQAVDDRDDLIRSLNGRVESLENQIATLSKDKSKASADEAQKNQLLQDALAKMETQIQKLEAEQIQNKAALESAVVAAAATKDIPVVTVKQGKKSTKENHPKITGKDPAIYDQAQGYFANHEWKKAILNYQKYVDDFPKGKDVSDSKYKIGVCFQELGMKEEAMAFFEEVVANYSKTDAGKKAKIRLAKLKK